jgi:small GTP-binding protein
MSYDYIYKIIIIGDSNVGKSNILSKYHRNKYSIVPIPTIGVDFSVKEFKIHDKVIKLQIWDTAGQERYQSLLSSYYRGISGALIVFDVTNIESFYSVENWYHKIKLASDDDIQILCVGNKIDLEDRRMVSKERAEKLCKEYEMIYIESSVYDDVNISLIFETLMKNIHTSSPGEELQDPKKIVIGLDENRGGCSC